MKSSYRCLLVGIIVMSFVFGSVFADDRTETFEFEDVHSLNIETVSGEVSILPGDESKFVVVLENDLDDPEQLDPEVEVHRGELYVEEHFIGKNVNGAIYWTIYVPKSAELRSIGFSTASGDFVLEDVDAKSVETETASGRVSVTSVTAKELNLSTASGAIVLEDCKADIVEAESASGRIKAKSICAGEIELSTASGKIVAEDCEADYIKTSSASGRTSASSLAGKEIKLSSASGRIVAEDCDIEQLADVSSASGDVRVYLPHLPSDHLYASTASGDVFLEVPQFGENFSMSLTKRADRGRIKCPFEYTKEETIRLNERDRYLTDRYLVERGKGGPDIELSTASGTITIETDTKGR